MDNKLWCALVLFASFQGTALADNGCKDFRLSAADRASMYKAAQALTPGAKFANKSVAACSSQSLEGMFEFVRAETAPAVQADGSTTWITALCHRKRGTDGWTCKSAPRRAVSMSFDDGATQRTYDVELLKADGKPQEVDAAAARTAFQQALKLAGNPTEDLAHCSTEINGSSQPVAVLIDAWKPEGPFTVSRLADEYFVQNNQASIFFRETGQPGVFEYHCWTVEVPEIQEE